MALWNIEIRGKKVALTYTTQPHLPDAVAKECGIGDVRLLPALLTSVAEWAEPYDLVRMPGGRLYMSHRAKPGAC